MQVREALPASHEDLCHRLGMPRFLLLSRELRGEGHTLGLHEPRLQRAIGVVYRPETERVSHYYHARAFSQFDAWIHVDRTRALEPLERFGRRSQEVPETFPSGL
jgi:erythromycin esterase-like protein